MQRIAAFTVMVISVSLGAFACGDKHPASAVIAVDSIVRSVTVTPQQSTVRIGEKVQLGASVDAGSLADRSLVWSSSNATIASVTPLGPYSALVTPGAITGAVNITATSKADTNIKGTSAITVSASASTRDD
jgi:uncharacterized protein YjdB